MVSWVSLLFRKVTAKNLLLISLNESVNLSVFNNKFFKSTFIKTFIPSLILYLKVENKSRVFLVNFLYVTKNRTEAYEHQILFYFLYNYYLNEFEI